MRQHDLFLSAIMIALIGACAPNALKLPWRGAGVARPGADPGAPPPPQAPAHRPFLMGFTLWPADLSREGVRAAEEFAYAHGDIVSIMLIGGIPWPEALEGKPYSRDVQQALSYRPPAGKKLFLSISPLDKDRRTLAPYWGERDSMPLPSPWDRETLNSARVKKAFLQFVVRSVQTLRPDYLAIGVESNVLLSREPAKWAALKDLHRETYGALKKAFPALPVFFTTEVLHYKKLASDAKRADQEREVAELMKFSDLFAMSVYPHMSREVPRPVPGEFLDFATRFRKPIAVSESGMTSRAVQLRSYGVTLPGSEDDQRHFTELLLNVAARDRYLFVINFATTDSDRLVARLRPPLDDLARIYAYLGMQTSDRRPKPASAVWDGFYRARYEKAKWW
ncbi:MAG TPA: hypothetical protein VNM15_05610 [Candidatus Binatia bacterium]|nr:hypothetical protein [Candidatus Binatia bacterium]